ncbi:TPA: DUF86 domain-containing protein [Candidatus Poribacteria bacterium]|nr:DUF86 domain-containing protein [Candidatus Poribacteria bacterium]
MRNSVVKELISHLDEVLTRLEERRSVLPRIHEMVGLRNALVHEYRRIEHPEVFRHLQESLPILREFASLCSLFLSEN